MSECVLPSIPTAFLYLFSSSYASHVVDEEKWIITMRQTTREIPAKSNSQQGATLLPRAAVNPHFPAIKEYAEGRL